MRTKLNFSSRPLRTMLLCGALASCGDNGGGAGGSGGMPEGECKDDGSGVRIHVVNSEDVANVVVSIATPHGNCSIDPLPTSDESGLELGQAVYPLQPGDVVSFNAQSPSGGASAQCRVTEMATTTGSAFVDLFITTSGFLCMEGLEPVVGSTD
jgi:hypothetical protein